MVFYGAQAGPAGAGMGAPYAPVQRAYIWPSMNARDHQIHRARTPSPVLCCGLGLTRYRGPCEQLASARGGGTQAPRRPTQGADRQPHGTRCLGGHHASGPQRVHLLGRGCQATDNPRTPHPPDPRGAGGRPASALLLARVHAPRTHRHIAVGSVSPSAALGRPDRAGCHRSGPGGSTRPGMRARWHRETVRPTP